MAKSKKAMEGEVIDPPKKERRGRPKGRKDSPNIKRKPTAASFGSGKGANLPGRPTADHTLRDLFRKSADEVYNQAMEWIHDPTLDLEFRLKVWDRVAERGWGPPQKTYDDDERRDNQGGGTQILIMGPDAKA